MNTQTFALPPEVMAFLLAIGRKALWLVMVIGLDVILGVVVALRNKTFSWAKTGDFLATYGAKTLGWLALELLGMLPDEIIQAAEIKRAIGQIGYLVLMVSGVGSILGHVQALGLMLEPLKKLGFQPDTEKKLLKIP